MRDQSTAGALAAALLEKDVCAYTEYALRNAPVPDDDVFVTVGTQSCVYGEQAVRLGGGVTVPVCMTLRIRMHCKTNRNPDCLTALWYDCILPALAEMGLAVRGISLGACEYLKALDRLVQTAEITVSAAEICGEGNAL